MKGFSWKVGAVTLLVGVVSGVLLAQQQPVPYFVGNRLGLPINPAPDGAFAAMSSNVKVYGAIYSAESCSYDLSLIHIFFWTTQPNVRKTRTPLRASMAF